MEENDMDNDEILAYLCKFENFRAWKLQRQFVWGNERAMSKINELVSLGLIHEDPVNKNFFKVSDATKKSTK